MRTGFQNILQYIRLKDWWNFIIPPVISFYCIGLLTTTTSLLPFIDIAFRFVTFLMLTILVAAFGFFLNEWSDIGDDVKAGKKNALRNLDTTTIILLFSLISAGIMMISILIHWHHHMLILLIIQLLLFILYSVHPFRLKRKKYIAILLDAVYSGTLFYIIAVIMGGSSTTNLFPPVPILFFWGLCRGVRNIMHHLMQDREHDLSLQINTIANAHPVPQLRKNVLFIVLPLEISSYFLLLVYSPYNHFFGLSFLLFLVYLSFRKNYIIPFVLKRKTPILVDFITDINLYYELLMPLVAFSLLVYKDHRLILLFALYLSLFPQVFRWIRNLFVQAFQR
jgi:4-hydroxybenzoate polyprenyltransferase